jgi:hypothetical protein
VSELQRLFLWILFAVCWANLLAIFVVGFEIGDASRGKIVGGDSYVKHLKEFVE